MAVPLSLTGLTSVASVVGIKFMYAQAGELINRRWRKTSSTLEEPLPAMSGGGRLTAELDMAVVEQNASRPAEPRADWPTMPRALSTPTWLTSTCW
jgi:hypothetical protein